MRAIDTNIVVRYLTGDDPGRAIRARTVVDGGDIFLCTAVLLESEWALRRVYGFAHGDVAGSLRAFSGLPGVSAENPALLSKALARAANGMDFADALHLGAAVRCDTMFTFDRRFIKTAGDTPVRVTEP